MSVYKAINSVQSDLSKIGIGKDNQNKQQGYKFRGIDDIYNVLASLLSKHGLCILPRVLSRSTTERDTKAGGVLFYTTVEVEFDFVCTEDGSKHTVKTFGEAMDSGDKSTNKAMSAAYKYACLQAFCIPTEGDNDADAQTHEPVSLEQEYRELCESLSDEIAEIKIGINKEDYARAYQAWASLSTDQKERLWKAPSKGGCFTTEEREIMKTPEFRQAV